MANRLMLPGTQRVLVAWELSPGFLVAVLVGLDALELLGAARSGVR